MWVQYTVQTSTTVCDTHLYPRSISMCKQFPDSRCVCQCITLITVLSNKSFEYLDTYQSRLISTLDQLMLRFLVKKIILLHGRVISQFSFSQFKVCSARHSGLHHVNLHRNAPNTFLSFMQILHLGKKKAVWHSHLD